MAELDSDPRTQYAKKTEDDSKSSLVTVGLSVATSLAILTWALMPPKRHRDKSTESGGPTGLVERIRQRRDLADEYRAYAESLDVQLMGRLRESREREPVPGIDQTREHWKQRAESTKEQIEEFKNAERGSLEWRERQRLMQAVDDGPR